MRFLFSVFSLFFLCAAGENPVCRILEKVDVSGATVAVHQYQLRDIPADKAAQVRREVIALARKLYDAGRAEGKDTLFPIDPGLYDGVMRVDARTGLSQVQLNAEGHVVGFVLAHQTENGAVHIEKVGVDPDLQKQGLMSSMLHETAVRAKEAGAPYLDLMVVKVNTKAHAAYEKVGFENVTPDMYRADPSFNAFAFAVRTDTLVQKTTPLVD